MSYSYKSKIDIFKFIQSRVTETGNQKSFELNIIIYITKIALENVPILKQNVYECNRENVFYLFDSFKSCFIPVGLDGLSSTQEFTVKGRGAPESDTLLPVKEI